MPTTNPTPGQSQQDQRQQQDRPGRPQHDNAHDRDPQKSGADGSNPDRRHDPNRDRDDQNIDRIDMDDRMETASTDNRGTDIRGNQSAREGGQPAQASQDSQGQNRSGQKGR